MSTPIPVPLSIDDVVTLVANSIGVTTDEIVVNNDGSLAAALPDLAAAGRLDTKLKRLRKRAAKAQAD